MSMPFNIFNTTIDFLVIMYKKRQLNNSFAIL